MEPQDVLPDEVVHDRPEGRDEVFTRPRIGERAQVVDERVGPDVGDLALVPRERDSPGLARATDAEVAEPAGDECPRLVVAVGRAYEIRTLVVDPQQSLLVGGEPKEVVLLLDPFGVDVMDRTFPLDQIVGRVERLATDAVVAGVDALVDVCLLYTSPSPRDLSTSRMPSSA